MPKPKMTKAERTIHETTVMNFARRLSYRVDRYAEAMDEGLKQSVQDHRRREIMRATEELVRAYTEGPSDGALRYFYGEKEVAKRDKLLGAGGNVTPFKRKHRPLLPLSD